MHKNLIIAIEVLLAGVALGGGRYLGLVFWERILLYLALRSLFELVIRFSNKK